MKYAAAHDRYASMRYNRCGRSGLQLPAVSLGLWHNFGGDAPSRASREMIRTAFDLGITHFDLANNYGPPPGSAERNFGRILREELAAYRDQIVISSKAGYLMWEGPYGEWGSRKYLMASLDQSLKRMGLEYVDIFYSHRPDPNTPLEETMGALNDAVRQGKALYAGISNYQAPEAKRAIALLRAAGTPCLIHQPSYSMLNRWVEAGLLEVLREEGVGCIAFSPLAKGLLTDRYLHGIPADSRAAGPSPFLKPENVTAELRERLLELKTIAAARDQSLAQMSVAWLLRTDRVTSVLIGASRAEQVVDCVGALKNTAFSPEELAAIEAILARHAAEGAAPRR
jgi:L-glyceraldehyde 3-phosphate reductase